MGRLTTLVPQVAAVADLIPQIHRKPPLLTTKRVLHLNLIQSTMKVLYQPPLVVGTRMEASGPGRGGSGRARFFVGGNGRFLARILGSRGCNAFLFFSLDL